VQAGGHNVAAVCYDINHAPGLPGGIKEDGW